MEIKGEKVLLRDFIKEDIEDRIRWETAETEWLSWDAPWEEWTFDPKKYRYFMIKRLAQKQEPKSFRHGFEICVNDEARKHIGWVNSYLIDENYCYTTQNGKLAIGIDIPELGARRKGYATEAWTLFIRYLLDNGIKEIYTQTWSGNERVQGLMNKLGFVECGREKDFRTVRGKLYDGLTFKLDIEKFNNFERTEKLK